MDTTQLPLLVKSAKIYYLPVGGLTEPTRCLICDDQFIRARGRPHIGLCRDCGQEKCERISAEAGLDEALAEGDR